MNRFISELQDVNEGVIDQDLAVSSSLEIYQGIIVTADNLFCVHPYSNWVSNFLNLGVES